MWLGRHFTLLSSCNMAIYNNWFCIHHLIKCQKDIITVEWIMLGAQERERRGGWRGREREWEEKRTLKISHKAGSWGDHHTKKKLRAWIFYSFLNWMCVHTERPWLLCVQHQILSFNIRRALWTSYMVYMQAELLNRIARSSYSKLLCIDPYFYTAVDTI